MAILGSASYLFSGRTVAASPAPVQVSSSGSRWLGVGDSYGSLTYWYETFKYELNNKLSKSNISRISGRSTPVRCHSVLKLHSWKGCRFFKGSMMERYSWLVYRRGWWYSSSRLKAGHVMWCNVVFARPAWWASAQLLVLAVGQGAGNAPQVGMRPVSKPNPVLSCLDMPLSWTLGGLDLSFSCFSRIICYIYIYTLCSCNSDTHTHLYIICYIYVIL